MGEDAREDKLFAVRTVERETYWYLYYIPAVSSAAAEESLRSGGHVPANGRLTKSEIESIEVSEAPLTYYYEEGGSD